MTCDGLHLSVSNLPLSQSAFAGLQDKLDHVFSSDPRWDLVFLLKAQELHHKGNLKTIKDNTKQDNTKLTGFIWSNLSVFG